MATAKATPIRILLPGEKAVRRAVARRPRTLNVQVGRIPMVLLSVAVAVALWAPVPVAPVWT